MFNLMLAQTAFCVFATPHPNYVHSSTEGTEPEIIEHRPATDAHQHKTLNYL